MSTSTRTPPAGYTVHREATAEILIPDEHNKFEDDNAKQSVFINPIQEFNRDLSVAVIRTWSEIFDDEKRQKFEKKQANKQNAAKKRKIEDEANSTAQVTDLPAAPAYRPHRFTLFEGLSATGLRSIRYAKEIPNLKWIQANDLSSKAAANITLNAQWNGLAPLNRQPSPLSDSDGPSIDPKGKAKAIEDNEGKLRVSQGDCCSVLYAHRLEKDRFDVVDLDPYGTAAPFIDGAVQAVHDGGLLCVTCTDLAVLAGSNYPEKCFSNYGGIPVKAEYTHEMALRLLLHTLATSAARYGRQVKPLLSLSIDYYVRVFVRVYTSPLQVKRLASDTAMVYNCIQCHNTYLQPLGKIVTKTNHITSNVNLKYGFASGPPMGQQCEQCNGIFQVSGPMWSADLHDKEFVSKVLQHVQAPDAAYTTRSRIHGMLTIAKHELSTPFYHVPSKVASLFHATCPPLLTVASALVNAGHEISRSHAAAGSIKTTAPTSFVFDVVREWIKGNPVKMANVKENSPARTLLNKAQSHTVDLTSSPVAEQAMLGSIKLVGYQQNPTAYWGPQARASAGVSENGQSRKRKSEDGEL